MADIKKLIGLSDWLTYRLKTTILNPPEIKLRMRPISGLAPLDSTLNPDLKQLRLSKIIIDSVMDVIEEWDVCIEGKPLELTPENKAVYLAPLLGEVIEKSENSTTYEPDVLLGLELLTYGRNLENFLKK